MNEAKLREYAELIVKIGANVQKGQRVRLQTGALTRFGFAHGYRRVLQGRCQLC